MAHPIHKILCVDDEPDIVDALERLFRKEYEIVKAHSGQDGLKLLAEHKVSLILSDQRMPQTSGVEFLKASQQLAPDAVRILLTGYSDIHSAIEAINTG